MRIADIYAQSFRMPRLPALAVFVRMRLALHAAGDKIYCTFRLT